MSTFTFGSLFSGIGGIDLGLERSGMQCEWQVENDSFCTKVLQKHWPNTPRFRDVRNVGRDTLARVDLIAGGFPCQPHSLAGERQASEDERDLWPEFYRIICELKPRWVVGENVVGLLSSEDGSFFGGVLRDLAQAGYDVEWTCLQAADVGAPHERERVFFVAYARQYRECGAVGDRPAGKCSTFESTSLCRWQDTTSGVRQADAPACRLEEQQGTGRSHHQFDTSGHSIMAHANCQRCEERHASTRGSESRLAARRIDTNTPSRLSQLRMGRVLNGLPVRLDQYRWPAGPGEAQHEWEPQRVITERLPNRTARLKALGNAVVPQLTQWVGERILACEEEYDTTDVPMG